MSLYADSLTLPVPVRRRNPQYRVADHVAPWNDTIDNLWSYPPSRCACPAVCAACYPTRRRRQAAARHRKPRFGWGRTQAECQANVLAHVAVLTRRLGRLPTATELAQNGIRQSVLARSFGTVRALRQAMLDTGHCTQDDAARLADYLTHVGRKNAAGGHHAR